MRLVLAFVPTAAASYSLDDPGADHRQQAIDFDEDGRMDFAIASFRAATRFTPTSDENWNNLGIALRDDSSNGFRTPNQQREAARAFVQALNIGEILC